MRLGFSSWLARGAPRACDARSEAVARRRDARGVTARHGSGSRAAPGSVSRGCFDYLRILPRPRASPSGAERGAGMVPVHSRAGALTLPPARRLGRQSLPNCRKPRFWFLPDPTKNPPSARHPCACPDAPGTRNSPPPNGARAGGRLSAAPPRGGARGLIDHQSPPRRRPSLVPPRPHQLQQRFPRRDVPRLPVPHHPPPCTRGVEEEPGAPGELHPRPPEEGQVAPADTRTGGGYPRKDTRGPGPSVGAAGPARAAAVTPAAAAPTEQKKTGGGSACLLRFSSSNPHARAPPRGAPHPPAGDDGPRRPVELDRQQVHLPRQQAPPKHRL